MPYVPDYDPRFVYRRGSAPYRQHQYYFRNNRDYRLQVARYQQARHRASYVPPPVMQMYRPRAPAPRARGNRYTARRSYKGYVLGSAHIDPAIERRAMEIYRDMADVQRVSEIVLDAVNTDPVEEMPAQAPHPQNLQMEADASAEEVSAELESKRQQLE